MLCGCIDIGTNTTRVLVAEANDGTLTEVLQRRAFTRLGRGLSAGGTIPAARIAETAIVVAEQVALARQAGAAAIRTVATAVIRSAANRDEFCAEIRRHGGVEVCVLDGEEEARLAFLGATRTLGRPLDWADRGGRRRRRLERDRHRHDRGRRRVVEVVQCRLRLPGRRPLRQRPADRRRTATPFTTGWPACWSGSTRLRSTPRSRSAGARRRCGAWSATRSTPPACGGRSVCSPAVRLRTSPSGSSSTSSGCG